MSVGQRTQPNQRPLPHPNPVITLSPPPPAPNPASCTHTHTHNTRLPLHTPKTPSPLNSYSSLRLTTRDPFRTQQLSPMLVSAPAALVYPASDGRWAEPGGVPPAGRRCYTHSTWGQLSVQTFPRPLSATSAPAVMFPWSPARPTGRRAAPTGFPKARG